MLQDAEGFRLQTKILQQHDPILKMLLWFAVEMDAKPCMTCEQQLFAKSFTTATTILETTLVEQDALPH